MFSSKVNLTINVNNFKYPLVPLPLEQPMHTWVFVEQDVAADRGNASKPAGFYFYTNPSF